MSREVAAATLTRIYFDKVNAVLSRRKPTEKIGAEAVDEIGAVYAAFLARMDAFQAPAADAAAPPKA
jgi:hypothetical protein